MTDTAWKRDALCIAALALAVAGFFPQVVLDGGVFFVQDMMVQNVPFRHFLHDALADGRLPLWEPRINGGFPLLAEGQVGALYPPNWVAAVLPPAQAVTWSVLLHLWLAASGTFLYLRHGLFAGRAASLMAGLCFGLSGYLVVRAMSPNFVAAAAGLPFLFLLIESGLRGGRPARIGVAGAVFALQLLAGHPQAAAYGALAGVAYAAVRASQLDRWRVALLGAAIAIPGAAIAAVQVLPTAELAGLSLRAGSIGYEQFVNMSLPPERLLTLLLPGLFGNSAHGSYWGGEGFFIQLCPYVGVLTLPLVLVGAREAGSQVRGFFALLAALGLMMSLGRYTGFFDLLHQIPLLSQLRIPTRFLLWWAFAAAVLAGLGVDRLVRDPRPLRGPWRLLWAGCVVVVIFAITTVWEDVSQVSDDVQTGAWKLLTRVPDELAQDLWRVMAGLGVTALLLSDRFRRQSMAPVLTSLAVVTVTWADLRSFGADFNGTVAASVYTDLPPSADAVRKDALTLAPASAPDVPLWGRFRVAGLISEHNAPYDWHSGWSLDKSSYESYPATLRMYSAGLFDLANTMPGWSPLHLSAHWEFARGYPGWLGMANTQYVVTHRPLPQSIAVPISTGQVVVSRLHQSLPRAWVVPEGVVIGDGEARLRHMRAGSFDAHTQVVLDREPAVAPVPGTGFAPAYILRYSADHVAIELPGRDGYLVLADTQAPGWRARVDGVAREILLANHVFRAVPVAAADAQVEFDYQPRSVVVGAWISAAAAILWISLCLLGARARKASPVVERVGGGGTGLLPLAVQVSLIIVLYGMARETELWQGAVERMQPSKVLRERAR